MLNKIKYWILGVLTVLALSAGLAYATSWSLPPVIQLGDLIVATSTTQAVRLATGTVGSVLSVKNNVPAYVATSTLGLQSPISLTTTGSSGAATFIANVLNIPNY